MINSSHKKQSLPLVRRVAKLAEMFEITKDSNDVLSSTEINKILERNKIIMNASKIKQRLEAYGAKYDRIRLGGRQFRGFRCLRVVSDGEEGESSEFA